MDDKQPEPTADTEGASPPPVATSAAATPAVAPSVSAGASHPVETRIPQPLLIRITHWLNIPFLLIMAMSGLQILMAYPYLGPHGAPYRAWPLQGYMPPAWTRMGDWLAGARHWHFAMAWFLAINGIIYVVYFFARSEWRRRLFLPRRDAPHALRTALHYVRIAKEPPSAGLYNGLQRLGYTSAVVLAVVEVLSGLAIYKPTQLRWLAAMFGGYDGARSVHLLGLIAIALFVVGHVVMVLVHPRTLLDMIFGGRRHE